jgi:hypothetical protein
MYVGQAKNQTCMIAFAKMCTTGGRLMTKRAAKRVG